MILAVRSVSLIKKEKTDKVITQTPLTVMQTTSEIQNPDHEQAIGKHLQQKTPAVTGNAFFTYYIHMLFSSIVFRI